VQDSEFFGRKFDAAIAWGLFFFFPIDTQRLLIRKVAGALEIGGKFLFTSPSQICTWQDAMTGRQSISPGFSGYQEILTAQGLTLVGTRCDEGDNHYYLAELPRTGN
jgi:hypothetical protein